VCSKPPSPAPTGVSQAPTAVEVAEAVLAAEVAKGRFKAKKKDKMRGALISEKLLALQLGKDLAHQIRNEFLETKLGKLPKG